jgi:hypothetical protein
MILKQKDLKFYYINIPNNILISGYVGKFREIESSAVVLGLWLSVHVKKNNGVELFTVLFSINEIESQTKGKKRWVWFVAKLVSDLQVCPIRMFLPPPSLRRSNHMPQGNKTMRSLSSFICITNEL